MGPLFRIARRGLSIRNRPNRVPPYGMLGVAYDHMMRHVDYEGWAEYIGHVMTRYGHGRRLLDAGCGTGRLLHALQDRGYHVWGFDRSRSMVKASRRIGQPAWVGDVTAMPVKPGWDAILCLYDVMLYLDIDGVRKTARDAKRLLRPGGLFIFDAVTENLVMDHWRRFSERGKVDGWRYRRQSWYDRHTQVQHTRVRLRHHGSGRLWTEHHQQRIFELTTLSSAVEMAGLKPVGQFHEMTFMPGSEASGRVHFVFRREDD